MRILLRSGSFSFCCHLQSSGGRAGAHTKGIRASRSPARTCDESLARTRARSRTLTKPFLLALKFSASDLALWGRHTGEQAGGQAGAHSGASAISAINESATTSSPSRAGAGAQKSPLCLAPARPLARLPGQPAGRPSALLCWTLALAHTRLDSFNWTSARWQRQR